MWQIPCKNEIVFVSYFWNSVLRTSYDLSMFHSNGQKYFTYGWIKMIQSNIFKISRIHKVGQVSTNRFKQLFNMLRVWWFNLHTSRSVNLPALDRRNYDEIWQVLIFKCEIGIIIFQLGSLINIVFLTFTHTNTHSETEKLTNCLLKVFIRGKMPSFA